jgi:hypothetical protein
MMNDTTNNKYKEIPKRWADFLTSQPETGKGYWIVSVITNKGVIYDRVFIAGSLITQVYDHDIIPFEPSDVIELKVTHDKWKFKLR